MTDFNEPTLRKPYESFEGKNIDQMPLLIADGRVPVSIAEVMERRLNSQNLEWKGNYFGTGDMIAYHPNGKFKIVRDAQMLRELSPKTRLVDGAIELVEGLYESLDGAEFNRKDVAFDRDLSDEGAKAHPVWQFVARDNALLNTYVDTMFPEMKAKFRYDEAMGIYLRSAPNVPQARELFVFGLGDWSRLDGGFHLVDDGGRLVGLAPEARSNLSKLIVEPTLEQAVSVVNKNMSNLSLRLSE